MVEPPLETPTPSSPDKIGVQSGPTTTTSATPRILIVEDEKDYRDILTERLELEKFTVLQAENGQVGLDLLKNQNVDLILLDMLMPKVDGVTFLYKLKTDLNKQIPVIILTNLDVAAYPEGIAGYLVKANSTLDEVVEKIKTCLGITPKLANI